MSNSACAPDPLVFGPVGELGDERYDPDRPGVLPIMKFDQVLDPEFPYHAKFRKTLQPILDGLLEAEKKDVKSLSPAEREKLENKVLRDPKNRGKVDPMLDKIIRDPMNIAAADRKELEKASGRSIRHPGEPDFRCEERGHRRRNHQDAEAGR